MLSTDHTSLLIIDVQGKLASLMHDHDKLFQNLKGMIKAAQIFDIPILYTEQLPEKIGPTVAEISDLLADQTPLTKSTFSCCGDREFVKTLASLHRDQILIAGIEAHVCVYQTVAGLVDLGYYVQVLADAISSRSLENKQIGLKRIQTVGGGITSVETAICELLKGADHPQFKEVLNILK